MNYQQLKDRHRAGERGVSALADCISGDLSESRDTDVPAGPQLKQQSAWSGACYPMVE